MKHLAAVFLACLALCEPVRAQEPAAQDRAAAPAALPSTACEVANDEAFAAVLADVTRDSVKRVHDTFDYRGAVQDAWRVADMDGVLAAEAEEAGTELRDELGPWWTYLTGWGVGAREAAGKVADRVFGGEAFETAVQDVARLAIEDLAMAFASDRERLVDPVQRCLTAYLDANYPAIVGTSARASFSIGALDASVGEVDGPRTLLDFATIVAGITLIVSGRIVRRIGARVAGGVARRVVGKIASRAIPIVGWLLLAWEAVFGQAGAVPSIVEAMHDRQMVVGLQTEIAAELKIGMGENLDEISDGIVVETLGYWRRFRTDHQTLLGLIETRPSVRAYLEGLEAGDDLAPVNVALVRVLEIGGEETLVDLVERGRIGEAVSMSTEGYRIARDLDDVVAALDWEAVAPTRLSQVLQTDLHRVRRAGDLTPEALSFVLDLGGWPTVGAIAAMSPDLVETLPRYGETRVKLAARAFDAREVGRYFAALRQVDDIQARNTVWAELSATSGRPDAFLGKVEAVAASRDQAVAADILFSSSFALLQPQRIVDAFSAAVRGEIAWSVVAERYWVISIVAAIILVFLLGPFVRALLPRRGRRR